jgi:hypothetical protein
VNTAHARLDAAIFARWQSRRILKSVWVVQTDAAPATIRDAVCTAAYATQVLSATRIAALGTVEILTTTRSHSLA